MTTTRPFFRTGIALVVCAAFLLLWATPAGACAVCYGDSDSQMVQGLEASVLFMVGVTYFVILGGVACFVLLRRRARDPGGANDSQQQQGA